MIFFFFQKANVKIVSFLKSFLSFFSIKITRIYWKYTPRYSPFSHIIINSLFTSTIFTSLEGSFSFIIFLKISLNPKPYTMF